jgi:HAD superfamily hydrolase (TIGR01509 family)
MRVLVAAIGRQGITLDPADAFRDFLGRSLASISKSLEERFGVPLGPEALESMRGELYALYREELQPSRGLSEMLPTLEQRICVASSSQPERIRISLELTGLASHFGANVFSASMVENGKPAPDLFLHAAGKMGVEPAACLVIEDSPAGVQAARAAGMRVFGYLGGTHVGPAGLAARIAELEPDAIFDDMQALPDLIALGTDKTAP